MPIHTVTSEDGIEYNVLETPGTAHFPAINYAGSSDAGDGYVFHHAYIPCQQLKAHGLPLDANPREPTRGDVVKKMEETLRESPERFHHWNNGITVICDEFRHDSVNRSIEVALSEGTGICNGGHTYFAISTFPTTIAPTAHVHVEFIKLPANLGEAEKKSIINDIASRRNRNRQLLPTTQADYLGYYDPFKTALAGDRRVIRWHEGDSDAEPDSIGSELFIRLLASVDPFWFYHPVHSPTKGNHKQAATSAGSIHRSWLEAAQRADPEGSLYHLAPIASILLKLVDDICFSLKEDNFSEVSPNWRSTLFYKWIAGNLARPLLFRGTGETGANVPNPVQVMILGAFRSSIWLGKDDDGLPAFVGFLQDPAELWDQAKVDFLRTLTGLYEDSGKEPNQYIKSNAPYEQQLMQIIFGRRAPSHPVEFFQIADGKRFVLDEAAPTHVLTCDEEGFCRLEPGNASGGAGTHLYRLI